MSSSKSHPGIQTSLPFLRDNMFSPCRFRKRYHRRESRYFGHFDGRDRRWRVGGKPGQFELLNPQPHILISNLRFIFSTTPFDSRIRFLDVPINDDNAARLKHPQPPIRLASLNRHAKTFCPQPPNSRNVSTTSLLIETATHNDHLHHFAVTETFES